MTNLNPTRVHQLFMECLYNEADGPDESTTVEGVLTTYRLHTRRTKAAAADIVEMLTELPDAFHKDRGGGMSFLNACLDRNGDLWTGDHATMDKLFILGTAVDKVACPMTRDMWPNLPGGMPYYIVDLT